MNNEQFRRLLNTSSSSETSSAPARNASSGASGGGLLGSRMRNSIPMTPRSVSGVDFARQLADQRREGDRPSKRFKSSAAPKGTKLPTGYQDRAQLRNANDEAENKDDLEQRIKALEEMVKLGQIDQATFDKLQAELGVGGDVGSTHMVKGLDWGLLRRVRAGEDVTQAPEKPESEPAEEPVLEEDAEAEFERLMEAKGQEEVVPAPKEPKEKKKGTMAPPPPRKKTRDEILKELRASRAAAAAPPPPAPVLGSKFKKLGNGKPEKKRFVEIDEPTGRRREVLVITDAEGNTKRKVRWIDKPSDSARSTSALPMPDKAAEPLGMEIPAEVAAREAAKAASEEDDDIFAGVGADYDPLAGIEDDASSSDEEESPEKSATKEKVPTHDDQKPPEEAAPTPRNYFGTSTASDTSVDRTNPLTKDPTIMAALKRAAALRQGSPSTEEGETPEATLRHKKFLEEARRRDAMDAADLDMGFGGSRGEDAEDEDTVLHDFNEDEKGGRNGSVVRRRGKVTRTVSMM
ncbi:uncharacterized protein N7477_009461 [Penicillium maclennaniae]|uniref:uncharacterized protein n=1 Tax=Penicillium maclennaniae TaxID=1343394 RepID=UPI00253F7561|nr:uncharacterized protein N7477_009461 [Penicillium maclennaniae]KAJ5661845.1 hypothetical protein N7477_009461 [Penicillium maclennaniae]